MKFCREEYEMTEPESRRIEHRLLQFQRYAEQRKSLRLTMITSYGIKRNTYSSIVQNEVTLADLFK